MTAKLQHEEHDPKSHEVLHPKLSQVEAVVRKNVYWAMGAALIPVPYFDIAAVGGVQLKMLADLSKIYGIKFAQNRAKSLIATTIGSVGAVGGVAGIASMAKLIPGVGQLLGIAIAPGAAGAATYAIGQVFIKHFESGGTFLDFDIEKHREHFQHQYTEGQKLTADLKHAGAHGH
ncbi:MAG: hypothetical protein JWN25_1836 [Verrucomicrobiales bacterium]|nr:hypothetical protein [Verrucomicrobiales bacterium]